MHVLSSTLDRVKVYAQGATIYRTLTLSKTQDQWPRSIEIPQLPLSLDDATARLTAKTHADHVTIERGQVGIHVKSRDHEFDTPEQAQIVRLERELHQKQAIEEDLEAEILFFEQFSVPPRPQTGNDRPPPASPMQARLALTTFMDDAIVLREKSLRELRQEISAIERQLLQIRQDLHRSKMARLARVEDLSKSFMAQILCTAPADTIELQLEYFIPGARWTPQYQCHIKRDGTAAKLIMRAVICQNSGEDWHNVHLSLSTAMPLSWTELPKLKTIRIGKHQPPPPQQTGFRPPPKGANLLFSDLDRDFGAANNRTPSPSTMAMPHLHSSAPLSFCDYFDDLIEDASQHHLVGGMNAPAAGGSPASFGASYDKMSTSLDDFESYDEEDDFMEKEVGMRQEMPKMMAELQQAVQSAPPPMAPPAPARRRSASPKAKRRPEPKPTAQKKGIQQQKQNINDFNRLHLGDPNNKSNRGRLQYVANEDIYRNSFQRAGMAANFNVIQIVQGATQSALNAASTPMPAGAVSVRQAAGHFDYLYQTRDRVEVPSDGSFHSVPVDDRTLECELQYVVVPRQDTQVYRIASLTNPNRAPILRGQAEIYVGGEFVLTTQIKTVGPKERFTLGLGVEQSIRCARNTKFKETRSGSAVVATAELWHTISIELHNQLQRAVQCEVRERIPQPAKDAEVVVEESDVSPAWEVYSQIENRQKIEGGRRWKVTLQPNEPMTLNAHYVVKIYANNELQGGNRREK